MDRSAKPKTDIVDLILAGLPENERAANADKLAKLPPITVGGSIHQFAVTMSGPITFTYSEQKGPGGGATS